MNEHNMNVWKYIAIITAEFVYKWFYSLKIINNHIYTYCRM